MTTTDADFSAMMRAAEAAAGTPSDAELYGEGFATPQAASPEPAEAAPVAPSESELIAGVGVDEQAALHFLDENPHVAGLLSQPTTDEGVAKNALLIHSLMQGDQAASTLAEQHVEDATSAAYEALYSGDEQETAWAAAELAGTVGIDGPDFQSFVDEWNSQDVEAAGRFLRGVNRDLGRAQAEQAVAAYQAQEQANAEAQAKTMAAVDQFKSLHPDVESRAEAMAGLAAELVATGSIDPGLMTDPATMHQTLGALHEASRQLDADTPGSPAWQAREEAKMLNAAVMFRRPGEHVRGVTEEQFLSQHRADGWSVEDGRAVRTVQLDTGRLDQAQARPLTQSEFEQAEIARIFGPTAERARTFRDEVNAVSRNGTKGDLRSGHRLGGKPRDAAGKFVSGENGESAAAAAVEAAPARPSPRTDYYGAWTDAYKRGEV